MQSSGSGAALVYNGGERAFAAGANLTNVIHEADLQQITKSRFY